MISKLDTIKDYSGIQCFKYGKMGEVTKQTRIYTLPSMANSIALSTAFQYDSWGRIRNMTYPDGEKLTYEYDYGGQLKSMKGVKDNMQYEYINAISYNKFGAKTALTYGNDLRTTYTYDPLNLRLDTQKIIYPYTMVQSATDTSVYYKFPFPQSYLTTNYKYDKKGNITSIAEKYSSLLPIPMTTIHEFEYDSASQLIYANESQQNLYNLSINYLNYGRIDNFDLQSMSNQTQSSNVYTNKSNSFASDQSIDNITVNGNSYFTSVDYVYGINGALRHRHVHQSAKGQPQDEFYLVDAFNNMTAYCDNKEVYAHYGYDDAGQRTYKMTFNNLNVQTNSYGQPYLQTDKMVFYPNGYININQDGEYTKHYYADDQRIASKIGTGNVLKQDLCSSDFGDLRNSIGEKIQNDLKYVTIPEEDVFIDYGNHTICYLRGDSGKYENDLFFHHENYLSSNQLVSDNNANIVQQIHYDPWGNVVLEYNQNWYQDVIPNFTYQAKIADAESGLIYFESRYYAPARGVFTRRDDLFEKNFYLSPYSSMGNNWLKYVDPMGMEAEEGDYYGTNGQWLFNDGLKDDKAYVKDDKGSTFVGPAGNFSELPISNSELLDRSTWVHGESGGSGETITDRTQNAGDANTVSDARVVDYYAGAINNIAKSYGDFYKGAEARMSKQVGDKTQSTYAGYFEGGGIGGNANSKAFANARGQGMESLMKVPGAQNSISAVISSVTGGADPTGGARAWLGSSDAAKYVSNSNRVYTFPNGSKASLQFSFPSKGGTFNHSFFRK